MFSKRKTPEQTPVNSERSADKELKSASEKPEPALTFSTRNTAMIGASIKIKGEISGDENLQIDGQVEGQVSLNNHDVTVGETGKVSADVNAKTVKIHGHLDGDINATEMVVVSKTGKVLGNIVAPRVSLEDGAQFKGSIDMGSSAEKAKSTPTAVNSSGSAQDEYAAQASSVA